MQPCLSKAQIRVMFMRVDRAPSFLAGMSFAGGRPSPDKRQRRAGDIQGQISFLAAAPNRLSEQEHLLAARRGGEGGGGRFCLFIYLFC